MLANATRSRTELYLIGSSVSELRGSKLPSLRMALGFFLHLHLELNERPLGTHHQNCQTKLEQAFEESRLLKKNKARKSSTQQAREAAFVSRLEDLFDIAHADALNTMSIQEDKDFFLAQREKGRRGSMVGVDATLACKEKRVRLTTSGSEISAAEDVDSEGAVGGSRTQKRKRGRKAVVTPELAAALDRTKVSDRKAVFVIAETAKSLGRTIDQLALNRDSVRRLRAKHRIHSSASIRAKFQTDVPLVVHWDGKLIPDLIGKEKVDRLPVLVSGKEVLQLLTVAKLPSGTGEAQASAVFGAIEDWGILGNIQAMCFDTTSSNTGRISGACVLLEQKLGKELLSLACRHHIVELVIGAAFRVCMGSTSSPEVPLFKRFQDYWRFIDTDKYETGIAADDVARLVDDIRQSTIDFANKHLEQSQPRDDYKEFLELVLIFLGAIPPRGRSRHPVGTRAHDRPHTDQTTCPKEDTARSEETTDVPLVVHWDGKLIPDLIGKEKVDRLPVLVSGKEVLQLLTVAKLPSGTGEAQASAVFGAIEDWGILGNIQAMCFDTTSSNTGRISGACVLLEQKLGKELLSLACRHHIMELVIGAAFRVCMGSTSSPEAPLFKRFQDYWRFIDTDKYETGIAADDVARLVDDIKQSTIDFANKHLEQSQPRDDCKEFLELVLIFLGAIPPRGVRFMSPGAMHHARWMSKVIYSLKIWMFKAQFRLTLTEERGLHDVCVFAVRVYLKAWISAPLASGAPYSDLLLLKSLLEYSRVSSSTKRLMVSAMQSEDHQEQEHTKRITIDLDSAKNKNLEHFVTAKSAKLFQMMDLPDGFLTVDPDLWEDRHDYKLASETVRSLKVINDHAERGVALIQEYSGFVTQDESQLQFLLQVVNEHRRVYPDSRKQTLSGQP
ncbi:hypothetical protein QYM36_015958 [Artemia franciscana]|uniref:Uncharacterized protein n=1 Tax=Artemia franciscana TaxID=6661 RepID=A0AA88KXE5_ARTSF|nr:hypothetical protein QYM36_015958 [Artemia franciscana]